MGCGLQPFLCLLLLFRLQVYIDSWGWDCRFTNGFFLEKCWIFHEQQVWLPLYYFHADDNPVCLLKYVTLASFGFPNVSRKTELMTLDETSSFNFYSQCFRSTPEASEKDQGLCLPSLGGRRQWCALCSFAQQPRAANSSAVRFCLHPAILSHQISKYLFLLLCCVRLVVNCGCPSCWWLWGIRVSILLPLCSSPLISWWLQPWKVPIPMNIHYDLVHCTAGNWEGFSKGFHWGCFHPDTVPGP